MATLELDDDELAAVIAALKEKKRRQRLCRLTANLRQLSR